MQDLDDQAQKLRDIFLSSASKVPIADEAAATVTLGNYSSPNHASNRLIKLLIVLEDTGQTVSTVRALANHFFLANVLDGLSEPIAEALNYIAACLPKEVNTDGTRIPIRPFQPSSPPTTKVTAFVRSLDDKSAWLEVMLIGRAFSVLKQFHFSDARTKAVADAATRIKHLGYAFSIRSGRYQIRSEGIENIVKQIWKYLSRIGCSNAISNIILMALNTHKYAYEQILFGRGYADGYGYRSPKLPIGLLYNIAVKLPAQGSNERNSNSFWDKAVCLARDLVAMLDLEPYSQFAFLGLNAQSLEDRLREFAHYDHCFALRQWHLTFTPQFLTVFFGEIFDADMKQRLGWNVAGCSTASQGY